MILAAALIIFNGIYVPWKATVATPLYKRTEYLGYGWIFAPPFRPEGAESIGINRTQFAIQLITLIIASTFLVAAFKDRKPKG